MASIKIGVRCRFCDRLHEVTFTEDQFQRYQLWSAGLMHIQDALPDVDVATRELFISGMCETCWSELFGEEEE